MWKLLLAIAALFASAALLAARLHTPTPVVAQATTFDSIGELTSWHVAGDGTVFAQVKAFEDGNPDKGTRTLWFRTPASQTSTTRFEDQTLEILLHYDLDENADDQLKIVADADRDKTGEDVKSAFVMSRIGHP